MKPTFTLLKLMSLFILPYLAWVSFAAVLNGSIWWLNKCHVSFSVQREKVNYFFEADFLNCVFAKKIHRKRILAAIF
jgi:hypothetical protein